MMFQLHKPRVLSPLCSLRVRDEIDLVPLACEDDDVHAVIVTVCTVLPAKSDSDTMLCLQSYQGLKIVRGSAVAQW